MTEISSKARGQVGGTAPITAADPAAKLAGSQRAGKPAGKVLPPKRGAAKPAAVPTSDVPAGGRPKPARWPSPVDATVDKHRQVLAEALEQAQAIQYDPPSQLKPAAKAEKPARTDKPAKVRKAKLVRDSFAMPEAEYAQIGELKKRLGGAFKKSELLRAGVAVLCVLNDTELRAVMGHIERIKTGRPAKK